MINKLYSRFLNNSTILPVTAVFAKGKYLYVLYLFFVVLSCCLLTEYISQKIHHSRGLELPFFFGKVDPIQTREKRTSTKKVIDPHLGYAHADTDKKVQDLKARHTWKRGFAIYSKKPLDQLERPIILAFGGSTTDPIRYGHSWPEELAKILEEKGISGTVINGGVQGYSTNQELIKLIRDGIELGPDVVISYSGVNDRGDYGRLPNPMIHSYQRDLLSQMLQRNTSPLMPNTIFLLENFLGSEKVVTGYTLGVATARSLGKWYERNLALMEAVARASGADFFAVIQPNAYVGDYDWSVDYERHRGKSPEYIRKVRNLYAEISDLPKRLDYVYDFTRIFSGINSVYIKDGVHATLKGNKVVANQMFKLIASKFSVDDH